MARSDVGRSRQANGHRSRTEATIPSPAVFKPGGKVRADRTRSPRPEPPWRRQRASRTQLPRVAGCPGPEGPEHCGRRQQVGRRRATARLTVFVDKSQDRRRTSASSGHQPWDEREDLMDSLRDRRRRPGRSDGPDRADPRRAGSGLRGRCGRVRGSRPRRRGAAGAPGDRAEHDHGRDARRRRGGCPGSLRHGGPPAPPTMLPRSDHSPSAWGSAGPSRCRSRRVSARSCASTDS